MIAVRTKNLEMAKYLVERGANLNMQNNVCIFPFDFFTNRLC